MGSSLTVISVWQFRTKLTNIFYPRFAPVSRSQFYLGRVLEQTGRKADAINAYKEFLSHFENSTAKLPQIAEACPALQRMKGGPPPNVPEN
jgi:hypothetical protein